MNIALWIVQGVLAALFLFGGSAKLTMPIDELAAMTGVPGALLVLASVCEILGGLGLVLPGIFRIYRFLTPLAAAGLVVIMTVATAMGVAAGDPVATAFPFVVGALSAFVAYGRSRSAASRADVRSAILRPVS